MITSTRTAATPHAGLLPADDSSLLLMEALRDDDADAGRGAATAPAGNERAAATVTSSFANGTLSVSGTKAANTIEIVRDAAGNLLVNGGAVPTTGGTPTVANTGLIEVSGNAGDDVITLNEAYGALPRANLYGGAGNDMLTGGSGSDQLFGQGDHDLLYGRGGMDVLRGGAGNDVLVGGDANDQMYGEGGNDRMVWNPGDDSDLMEGGDGIDTAEVNGGGGNEAFTVIANGDRVRVDRVEPAPFALDIGTTENLVVNLNGGDDTFSATGNLSSLIRFTVDGGTGNDTILGGNGADQLLGGDGSDLIDGQQGNDTALLGAGDDVFQWDAGDGNDVVEGQEGNDTLRLNGSSVAETVELSGNAGRLRLTRNVGSVVTDVNDVERVELNAGAGTDTVVVGDLTGTDAVRVDVNLAAAPGGTVGDGAADTVVATGTANADIIDVFGSATGVSVLGLTATVNVTNSEGALDTLVVKGGAGEDSLSAVTLTSGITKLTLDGGDGNDTLMGSAGSDVLIGGAGNDFVLGNQGNDVALLGAGDDTYQWSPGHGSDGVEGQEGVDTLVFFGANVSENIDIAANGGRVRVARDIATVSMDLDDVEHIEYRGLAGADNVVVGDLSGTDVTQVKLDLQGPYGGPDGAVDNISVTGSGGNDLVTVSADASGVLVSGLPAAVTMTSTDAFDRLTINGSGGDDTIDASALGAGIVQLTLNGGLGADVLKGSAAGDLLNGGDGNDTAFMGAGDDTFVWNPGDDNDVLEGQAGYDILVANGANVAENVAISANGDRASLTRDVASVTVDMNDVERVVYNALGGADNVVINDLAGTDVRRVEVNLAGSDGLGDLQSDNVVANGSSGDDVVQLGGDYAGLGIMGLAAQIVVSGGEAAYDTVTVNGGGGDDVIDASGVVTGAVKLVLDGGDGADVLIGSAGDDVLIGGAGDDVIIGGGGNDVIIGGDGDDIEIQDFVAGAGTDDQIDLSGRGLSFDWLMAHAHEVDGSTVLDLGGQHITLQGVSLDSLHQDDFLM